MTRRPTATRLVCALVLVSLVVLAGCTNLLSPGETTPGETTIATTEPSPTETTVASPTDTNESGDGPSTSAPADTKLPPGVTTDGLDNATALLDAHSHALAETGFVAIGNGTSVIVRRGVLIEVETSQLNRVAAGGTPYQVNQSTVAGPIQREVHAWSNGSVEYRRTVEGGETNDSTAEPRPIGQLAGRRVLGPYLRGGNFTLNGTDNGTQEVRAVLVTTEVADATALQRAVPNDAEEITSYEARITVDVEGRIHSLEATIGYVIGGREATQVLDYTVEHVGDVDISRPAWVEEDRDSVDETG